MEAQRKGSPSAGNAIPSTARLGPPSAPAVCWVPTWGHCRGTYCCILRRGVLRRKHPVPRWRAAFAYQVSPSSNGPGFLWGGGGGGSHPVLRLRHGISHQHKSLPLPLPRYAYLCNGTCIYALHLCRQGHPTSVAVPPKTSHYSYSLRGFGHLQAAAFFLFSAILVIFRRLHFYHFQPFWPFAGGCIFIIFSRLGEDSSFHDLQHITDLHVWTPFPLQLTSDEVYACFLERDWWFQLKRWAVNDCAPVAPAVYMYMYTFMYMPCTLRTPPPQHNKLIHTRDSSKQLPRTVTMPAGLPFLESFNHWPHKFKFRL